MNIRHTFKREWNRLDSGGEMNPKISIRQLQYFVFSAKHGSYKKAASVLNVSPSSVSLSVGQLEKSIGLQLFKRRHARGLLLTDQGKETLIEARNILRSVEEIGHTGKRWTDVISGTIEVGVLPSVAPFIIPTILERFNDQYPNIEVLVREGYIEDLFSGLMTSRTDLAITFDTDLPAAITTQPILELRPKILVSQQHPLAQNDRISLKEMHEFSYILADFSNTRDYIFSVFSECGLSPPRIGQRVQSFELLRNLVGRSQAYSLVNISPPFGNDPGAPVKTIEIEEDVRTPVLSVAWLRRVRPSQIHKNFIEIVDTTIRDNCLLD